MREAISQRPINGPKNIWNKLIKNNVRLKQAVLRHEFFLKLSVITFLNAVIDQSSNFCDIWKLKFKFKSKTVAVTGPEQNGNSDLKLAHHHFKVEALLRDGLHVLSNSCGVHIIYEFISIMTTPVSKTYITFAVSAYEQRISLSLK